MPIPDSQRPPEPSPAAIDANRRGVLLHAQGRTAQAADAFREGIAAQPDLPLLHANLATLLAEGGDVTGALREYETALACDPNAPAALTGLGSLYMRRGEFAQARRCFERVLARNVNDLNAHQAMYELEQIDGDACKALQHQRHVLEHKTLFSRYAPREERRLLALMIPGDWQANVPVDFLIDPQTTTLHKLFLVSAQQTLTAALPRADAVFTAIGESEESLETLTLATRLVRRLGLPVINDPRRVAAADRATVSRKLAGIPNVHAPMTARVRRGELASRVGFPVVIRPVGSQAGRDFARINDTAQLRAYVERVEAQAFYAAPFVDFRAPDGYYRKYRIIVVDGVPYPYHLAISPDWMIHYYNAPMRRTPWMREEERFFLTHFAQVFAEPLQEALSSIARALGLDYVGIDCSIDSQGRLLVFEADPAMVVHASDDPQLFAYKYPHAERIFDAFAKLVDRARSR